MRVTSKGQVTIPQAIRNQFGFLPETEVEFIVDGDDVRIVKAESSRSTRAQDVIRRLRGSATGGWFLSASGVGAFSVRSLRGARR